MRSALVKNLHLGRLLARRFGKETARQFFEEPSHVPTRDRPRIEEHLENVPLGALTDQGSPIDQAWALEMHQSDLVAATSGSRAEGGGVARSRSRNRADGPEKPTGDVYEALVGLVLLETRGDIDKTWRVFKDDLYATATGDRTLTPVGHAAEGLTEGLPAVTASTRRWIARRRRSG